MTLPRLPPIFNAHQRQHRATSPEARLLLAILVDAVACARGRGARTCQCSTQSRTCTHDPRRDALSWLLDDRTDWPMAFRPLCDHLGLDAQAVRGQVMGVTKEHKT